jgi:plasmid replication initiation protein
MSKIKSALELAMEKTEGIQVDQAELSRKRLEKAGREIYVSLQNAEAPKRPDLLKQRLEGYEDHEKKALRQSILEGTLSQISLARATYPEALDPGTQDILGLLFAMDISPITSQLGEMFTAYKGEIENLQSQLRSQMASRMGPKLKALAEQTGQSPESLVEQDPEYQRAFSHHLGQLKDHYQNSLSQLKDYLRSQLPA